MATFGETLKRERELRKISLREVSEATKIGLRYLEALEANRFDQLPGGLFNKGFIRAYSKFIGLDGEAMVNAYLFDLNSRRNPPPPRPRYAGFSIEETAPPVPPAEEHPPPAPSRRWALAGVLGAAVLVVAAGLWLVVFRRPAAPPGKASSSRVEEEKAQIAGEPAGAPAGIGSGTSAPIAPETKVPVAPPPAAEEAPPPAIEEETEKPAPEPEVLSLVLSVSETTWIAVVCDGTERLSKEIAAGDTVHLSCRNEIRLDSGNAGTMTLQINGNDCLPLGERGAVIHEVFDRNRAMELCPPPSREH
jgi:cytoskeleton protein RodZ